MISRARTQKTLTLFLAVLILLLSSVPLHAKIHFIEVGDFFFSPTKVVVNAGDTVRWDLLSGFHTSTSTAGSAKFWDSGLLGTISFDVVFTSADGPGPFPYNCSVHPFTMIDTIFMAPPSCCTGLRGDFNGDGSNATVLDLSYLVDDIFRGGPASACPDEADINGDGQVSTVTDLTFLIDLIFRGGVAPGFCP